MSTRRSVSQHTSWMICGEAYRRNYIEGDKRPIGSAGKRGSAVDTAANKTLECKMNTGELLPTKEVGAIARAEIHSLKKRDVHLTHNEEVTGWLKTRAKLETDAALMAEAYNDLVAPKIDPAGIQVRIEQRIPNTDITLLMFLDVVEKSGTIRDTKTKNRDPGQNAAVDSVQLATYAWGAHQEGTSSLRQVLDVLMPPSTRNGVRYKEYAACHGSDSQARALARIVETDYAIRQGVFPFAEPDSWKCTADYCAYYHDCPGGRGVAPTFFGQAEVAQEDIIPEVDEDQMPDFTVDEVALRLTQLETDAALMMAEAYNDIVAPKIDPAGDGDDPETAS